MALIECEALRRHYRLDAGVVRAVDGVDLEIDAGSWIAIVGPSGSGKSTLLHLLGCLDRPDGGRYRFDGKEVASLDDDGRARLRRRQLGFVFQGFQLLGRATAWQNVALPLVYDATPRAEREARAAEVLERVGLGDRMRHRPNQLSGGQCQRVAIARALINRPRVLFADEPTGNLDTRSGEEILDLLAGLHAAGHTLIMVTHEAAVAARAQRVIRMRDGRIEDDGPPP